MIGVMLSFIARHLCSTRFVLILTVVLNIREFVEYTTRVQSNDFRPDHLIAKGLTAHCRYIQNNLEDDVETYAHNVVNYVMGKFGSHRKTEIFRSKITGDKIIAKSYPKNLKALRNLTYPLNRENLKRQYLAQADLHVCPPESIQEFVDFLAIHGEHNETTVWLLMLTNPQTLIQSYLQRNGFPVPQLFGICGWTAYQEHVGPTLVHYYAADFAIKLRIGKQLLESALKFTNGFEGYRMYITDITADNLVYNVERDKLYFIDLNTAYIVNARRTLHSDGIDQHENIACDDCFAFVPQRLCMYGISDLNLLESCRFLHEDLKRDRTKGFLKPIPAAISVKYPHLEALLDLCVDGDIITAAESKETSSRFLTTLKLIELIANILNDYK